MMRRSRAYTGHDTRLTTATTYAVLLGKCDPNLRESHDTVLVESPDAPSEFVWLNLPHSQFA